MSSPLFQVSDVHLASQYTAYAVSGPTVQDGLPVFHWSRFNKTLHQGMPDTYNFDFITMKPILKKMKEDEAEGNGMK